MLAVIFSFSKRGGLLNAAIGRFLAGIGCEAKCCTMPKFAGVCEGLTAVDDYKAVCAEYFNKAAPLRRMLKAKPPTRQCLLLMNAQTL